MTVIRTVGQTGSTNADLLALLDAGAADEGLWLRADRQTAGRGRQGRAWASPPGNFYGSTTVRIRPVDPPAATLGFVAAVALDMVVLDMLNAAGVSARPMLKWPNDLLLEGAKLSGILLERAGDAIVVGIGVNLAHHPDVADRRTISLAALGIHISAADFVVRLADTFAGWVARWRNEGFAVVRARWLERAHPPGTMLRAALPDGTTVDGGFETLDGDGALILRTPPIADGRALADGERRAIHAGDVFLV